MYYILALAVLIIITVAFLAGRNYPSSAYIETIVKERLEQIENDQTKKMKALELRVQVLNQELKQSKLKYQRLKGRIAELVNQEGKIQPPKTKEETIERVEKLGYKTN